MAQANPPRRKFLKYGVAGIVVIAAAGAGAYYILRQPGPAASSSSASSSASSASSSSQQPSSSASSSSTASASSTAAPVSGGTLNMAGFSTIPNADPIQLPNVGTYIVGQNVLGNMMYLNADLTLGPDLATSWDISSDATTYTFHLRQGVVFHDGSPWNSDAANWNFQRVLDPATKSTYKGQFTDLAGITTPDEYTLTMTMKMPDGLLLQRLYFPPTGWISSKQAVQQYGTDYGVKALVGTGPFILKSLDPTTSAVVMVKNPNYWNKGLPYLDQINVNLILDATGRAIALQSGQVDYTQDPPANQVPTLKGDANLNTYVVTAPAGERILLDCKTPPFDDKRVRQALSLAIDRNAVNQAGWAGLGQPAFREVPPAIKDFFVNEPLSNYAYNPTQAKSLLQAYMADKNLSSMPPITLQSIPATGLSNLYSPVLIQNLAAIGWTLNIKTLDSSTWVGELSAPFGQHHFDNGWMATNNPAQNIQQFFGYDSGNTRNYCDYSNPQMDALIKQLFEANTLAAQQNAVTQLENLVNTEFPCIYMVWTTRIISMNKKVQGFQPRGDAVVAYARDLWLSR